MFTQIGVCERIDTSREPDELPPFQQPVEVLRGDADGGEVTVPKDAGTPGQRLRSAGRCRAVGGVERGRGRLVTLRRYFRTIACNM